MKKFIIILVIIIFIIIIIIQVKKYSDKMAVKNSSIQKYSDLPFISKVSENQEAFGEKVISISNDLGIKPEWLMVVMNNESGVNSKAKNPTSSATGLIQFMDATAKQLGTTTDELYSISNVDQLDYVKKYLEAYSDKIHSVSDTYLAVFYPEALYKDDTFMFPNWAVNANKIFFNSGNTKADFVDYVNAKYYLYV